jgi:hypothetical protein
MTTVPHNSPAHVGLHAAAAAFPSVLLMPAPGTDQWANIRHKLAEYRAEGKGDPRLLAQPAHPAHKDKEKQTKNDEEEEEAKSNGSH